MGRVARTKVASYVVFMLLAFVLIFSAAKIYVSADGTDIDYILGDVNNDGVVNSADAVWLLRHTLFPNRYVINQPADFNNDGKEDSGDAVWLLRHTLFPSRYPLYSCVYCSVTWKNYDGSVITTTKEAVGSVPSYSGATPTRDGTEQILYIFTGWSPSVAVVCGDAEYTSQFKESLRTFKVTFKDWNGEVLKEQTVNKGEDAAPPDNIKRDGYAFIGWNGSYTNVTADVVLTAVYTQTTTAPTFVVESKSAFAGQTISVCVNVKNNPGVAGAILTLLYDNRLKLESATVGDAFSSLQFTGPGMYSNRCNFMWDSESGKATDDGTVLTLLFTVSNSAVSGDILNIDCSYRYGDIYDEDLNDITFNVTNGKITVE